MKRTITYRKAQLSDSMALYELVCDLEGIMLSYEKFYDILNEQLQDRQHYYFLVCEHEGRIIGNLNLRFERQLHHAGPVAEITEFYIAPDCRKEGVGRELFEKGAAVSKEFGCRQLEADCSQSRDAAHRFYMARGMSNTHYKFTMPL